MKKRNLLLGIALTLSLGASGIVLGSKLLSNTDNGLGVYADSDSIALLGTFNDWSKTEAYTMSFDNDLNQFKITVALEAGDNFKIVCYYGSSTRWIGWDFVGEGNASENLSTYFSEAANDRNVNVLVSGVYTFKAAKNLETYGDVSYGVHVVKETSRTITKYAVLEDSDELSLLGTDSALPSTVYAVPGVHRLGGYHFVNWYSDVDCTELLVDTVVSEDFSIYGKFTKLINDDYFFVIPSSISEVSWNTYSFGSETYDQQYGSWPGKAIASEMIGVTSGDPVTLGGVETSVYKVPFATSAKDTHVILNDGGSNQTKNLDLSSKIALFWNGVGVKVGDTQTAGDADLDKGKVIDLVWNIKEAIDAATDQSVCNVSKEKAKALVDAYNALPITMATYWADSSIKTYTGESLSEKAYVPVSGIMNQLSAIAGAQTNPLNHMGMNVNKDQTVGFIVAGVSVLGLVAVGGIFLLRKKKEN